LMSFQRERICRSDEMRCRTRNRFHDTTR
jgi:hypothetical protein